MTVAVVYVARQTPGDAVSVAAVEVPRDRVCGSARAGHYDGGATAGTEHPRLGEDPMSTVHEWLRERGGTMRYRVGSLAAFAARVVRMRTSGSCCASSSMT